MPEKHHHLKVDALGFEPTEPYGLPMCQDPCALLRFYSLLSRRGIMGSAHLKQKL